MTNVLSIKSSIKALAAAVVVLAVYTVQPYRPMVVSGESMSPTYRDWQFVVADRRLPQLKRDDVVVVKTENGVLLKRVAFVAGDSYLQWKRMGELWDMVEVVPSKNLAPDYYRIATVPENHIYVVGDNLRKSSDSRNFGPVPVSDVIAWLPGSPRPGFGAQTVGPLGQNIIAQLEPRVRPVADSISTQ